MIKKITKKHSFLQEPFFIRTYLRIQLILKVRKESLFLVFFLNKALHWGHQFCLKKVKKRFGLLCGKAGTTNWEDYNIPLYLPKEKLL